MRIGVDVGGTNTDAVLVDGATVVASTKQPTSADISSGITSAVVAILEQTNIQTDSIGSITIGTTHFTNALVQSTELDQVGIIRLASPSGEALPPLTGWPSSLASRIGGNTFLLPGGYEVDGREISALDERLVRDAAQVCQQSSIKNIAISSAFAPLNASMEMRAAEIVKQEFPQATLSLSHLIGRIGLIERENSTIINAALSSLAERVIASFQSALKDLRIAAPLYISQNDGTLISAAYAAQYPVMTIGSGPTNSMRGAAFLSGLRNAVVMDVGGTTCDIGVLVNGYPRESSLSANIGGVRTNFRTPDIYALGLGGGTRIHADVPALRSSDVSECTFEIGPDSLGYKISRESYLFGGSTLTASDVAVRAGFAKFGDSSQLPPMSEEVVTAIIAKMRTMLEDGLDRMKTSIDDVPLVAVGGGSILIGDQLRGCSSIVRPPHASVANAVGAAIGQIGSHIEQLVDYDQIPRDIALDHLKQRASERVISAGGRAETVEIVEVEEVLLSYLPGRSTQVRLKAVGDLGSSFSDSSPTQELEVIRHAN
ncbi:MAG: hydantoinase/oxoprolinase family protein [Pseudomonadota bacterium]